MFPTKVEIKKKHHNRSPNKQVFPTRVEIILGGTLSFHQHL